MTSPGVQHGVDEPEFAIRMELGTVRVGVDHFVAITRRRRCVLDHVGLGAGRQTFGCEFQLHRPLLPRRKHRHLIRGGDRCPDEDRVAGPQATLSVCPPMRSGSPVVMIASISSSPLENHGRSSQMRTPLRRVRRTANGCSGSVVCSHMNIGITSCTTGGAGAAELGTLTATSLPIEPGSSAVGSSSGAKNSR